MKIICDSSKLMNAVQIVSKAVPNNTTMSILQCILITASNGCIKMTANDMELGIETILEGTIEKEGMVAIDAGMLSGASRKLPEGMITLETNENNESFIYYGKEKLGLKGREGDDFSYLPVIERKESIIISAFTLKEIIRQTIFSIGVNESNKIMTGIHLMIQGDRLQITSLDGHRISIRKVILKNSYEEKEVIIPGKTLNEISKILPSDAETDVNIYFSDAHVLFEFNDTVVVSRLIEGKYFSVEKMLSSDYETKISVNRKQIFEPIDRSMLFSKEGNKKPIVLSINDNVLGIKVDSTLGGIDSKLDIEKEGKDITIGFNPKFLLDALKVIDDEVINIYFVNPKAPCYIKDDNDSYTYLILPVNLS